MYYVLELSLFLGVQDPASQPLELSCYHAPTHRMGQKALVIFDFFCQRPSILRSNAYRAGHRLWKPQTEFSVGDDGYLSHELLHVSTFDPFRKILGRHHLSVAQRHRQDVRETVVCLFLCLNREFLALLAPSDYPVGDVEYLDLDRFHVLWIQRKP